MASGPTRLRIDQIEDRDNLTHAELQSAGDIYIELPEEPFPITGVSSSISPGNGIITAPAGTDFDVDQLAVGDLLVLTNMTPSGANGTFILASIDSGTQLSVDASTPITTAGTGGDLEIFYPDGSRGVGYDPSASALGLVSTNVGDALDEIASIAAGTFAFKTITNPLGADVVADAVDDTLNLVSANSSIDITGTAGTDTLDFQVNPSFASAILTANIQSTDNLVQTTSDIYSAMPAMTFTVPEDGKYFTIFSGDLENSNNKRVTITIEANGVEISHSIRSVDLSSNKRQVFQTQALSSGLLTGQQIKVLWKTDGGTASSYHRSIIFFRIRE